MPDIFGREAHQYSHIRSMQEAGIWEDQRRMRAAEFGGQPHDFGALGRADGDIRRAANPEQNAQAFGYLTNNIQAIHSMMEEILYTSFRLPEFIPLVTDVPEGAATYAYRVVDRAGLGQFIDNDGTSAPSANVGVRLVPYGLEYAGIIPEWTMEDLRRAMLAGVPLDSETVEAGMQGALDHIEMVGLLGDKDRGFQGLTNLKTTGSGAVTKIDSSHSNTDLRPVDFSGSTSEAIRNFVTAAINQVISATAEVFGRTIRSGLTIYLPIDQFNIITSDPIGDNADRSIWQYIQLHNAWSEYTGETPMLKAVQELKGAGASSTDRMIVTVNDRRVMEMAIPIYPRILTTINKGYTVCSPMEYKISGLNVKRPTAIFYFDGI
ncbi:MAG: DUF2184 domain-containing protein [Gemmatimonadetes bacterium]|nr:DUF2184 domain-containing protein [Gemmatimonadota bacterium]